MAKAKGKRRSGASKSPGARATKRAKKATSVRAPRRKPALRRHPKTRIARSSTESALRKVSARRPPKHWTERIVPPLAQVYVGAALVEPPKDRNPANLLPAFRNKLESALNALIKAGTPFKFDEGFRTVERQQWLYGQGRPKVKPYGRPGEKVTDRDGVRRLSKHQGTGQPGTGRAADCYPMKDGKVYLPPATDPVWEAYAQAVENEGLVAGLRWKEKDSPHCELA